VDFWAKNGGEVIGDWRFSIADWVETLIFALKTGVETRIRRAMGIGNRCFWSKNGVR